MFPDVPKVKRKRRKGHKRMTFETKAAHIIDMMTKNANELYRLRGVRGWGFNLSQIADMIAYQRSTALLNDLLRMTDEGALMLDVRPNLSSGISSIEYWFYTLTEHRQALKQGKLFQ